MKRFNKKEAAFSLTTIIIIFAIIFIIFAFVTKMVKTNSAYSYKMMQKSTLQVLREAIGSMICEGIVDKKNGIIIKSLPITGRAFCIKLSKAMNAKGDIDCTISTSTTIPGRETDFSKYTPNFVTEKGLKFYNLASDAPASDSNVYSIYIDVNGSKGLSKLYTSVENRYIADVYKFYISKDGIVYSAD